MLRTAFLVTILGFIKSVQAAEPPISVAQLAEITGYPAEKIVIEDGTDEANRQAARKKRPPCLSHHYYRSREEDTFASISIAIGKKGAALSPELEAKFSKALQTPNYPGNLKALNLGDGINGYSGIGMVGAGGSMHRGVISLSNYDRDIQVTVSLGEEGLKPLAGAEAYRESVFTFDGVNAIIEKCLTVASNNVIAALNGEGTSDPVPISTETPQTIRQPSPQQSAPKKLAVLDVQREPSDPDSNAWIWWMSGLALAVLALIAHALRKRRR